MKSSKWFVPISLFLGLSIGSVAQDTQGWRKIKLGKQTFELRNVKGEIVSIQGGKALKLERDLTAFPFDEKKYRSDSG